MVHVLVPRQETARSPFTSDLARVLARAGIDPAQEGADLQEAVHRAIAMRRYSCTWAKVHAGWVVTLQFPELHRFFGETLEDALTWCLAWIMAEETGRRTRAHERSQRTG